MLLAAGGLTMAKKRIDADAGLSGDPGAGIEVTDEAWERIAPLLPRQSCGGRWDDHRTTLSDAWPVLFPLCPRARQVLALLPLGPKTRPAPPVPGAACGGELHAGATRLLALDPPLLYVSGG